MAKLPSNLNFKYVYYGISGVSLLVLLYVLLGFTIIGKQGRVEEALLSGQRLEIALNAPLEPQTFIPDQAKKNSQQASQDGGDQQASADTDQQPGSTQRQTASSDNPLQEAPAKNMQAKPEETQQAQKSHTDDGAKRAVKMVQKQRKDFIYDPNKPAIVMIIKGLGLSATTTEMALDMSTKYTLGLTPYAPSIADWASKATGLGFDVVLHVPMEVSNFGQYDPGPYALQSRANQEDNVSRIEMLLNLVPAFTAIYTESDEVFSHTLNNIKPVLTVLNDNQIPFIYGGGYGNLTLIQYTERLVIPFIPNDLDIDEDISSSAISAKLGRIERLAVQNNRAVAMARPYPITLRILDQWQKRLEKRDIQLIPLSVLLGENDANIRHNNKRVTATTVSETSDPLDDGQADEEYYQEDEQDLSY